jgi:predicted transposase/invertase (TIGR01784 family)
MYKTSSVPRTTPSMLKKDLSKACERLSDLGQKAKTLSIKDTVSHGSNRLKTSMAPASYRPSIMQSFISTSSQMLQSWHREETIGTSSSRLESSTLSTPPYRPSLMRSTMAYSTLHKEVRAASKVSATPNGLGTQRPALSYRPSPLQIALTAGVRDLGYRQFSTEASRIDKFGDPKNDVVFKKLFGNEKNKDLLIDFINSVLPEKHVEDVEYIPTNLEPEIRAKKQSILDVLCTDKNGSKYIIEIQNAKEKSFEKSALYYASYSYSTQLNKGVKYSDLKEVIFIAITDFVMFPEKEAYISTHTMRDRKTNEHDWKDFSFAFIELPKYKEHDTDRLQGVDAWCDLFKYATGRKEVSTSNPIIKKAYETLEMSNWTEQELLDYQAYDKITRDNQAREDQVRDEGEAEGRVKVKAEIA